MNYKKEQLNYDYNELEPFIDQVTMETHYEKHHEGYTTKLNAALQQEPVIQNKKLEELLSDLSSVPETIRESVRNNGGGYINHNLFWKILTPGGNEMSDRMRSIIEENFSTVNSFEDKFTKAASSRFGSGWAWLCKREDGGLIVNSTPNQDSPISVGLKPILGLDVWEHAYYLKYKNKRPEYINNFFNVIDWSEVENIYDN